MLVRPNTGCHSLVALTYSGIALVMCVVSATAMAEPEPPAPIREGAVLQADQAMRRFAEGGGLIPPFDRDAERWLRRAQEAARRSDWKLAIDTLERVIRDHGTAIVATGNENAYRSASDLAVEQLASLPPDGLKAYRVLNDPIADRLFAAARDEHDLDALREIADVYAVSTVGPQALDMLTGYLLDARQPLEALDYLGRLSVYATSPLEQREIGLRRALAFAMIGRTQASAAALDLLARDHSESKEFITRLEKIRAYLEADQIERFGSLSNSLTWTSRMGPAADGRAPIDTPVISSDATDYFEFPLTDRPQYALVAEMINKIGRPPVWQMVSDGSLLFVTCPTGLYALDPTTLELSWRAFPKSEEVPQAVQNFRLNFLGGRPQREDRQERLDEFTTQALYREYQGAVATGLGLTFVLQQSTIPGEARPTKRGKPAGSSQFGDLDSFWANSLIAYEADNGRVKWILGRGSQSGVNAFAGARFYCTPIVAGDELLVTYVRQSGDLYLGALDKNGNLLREVTLGAGSRTAFPFYGLLEPAVSNGRVYVPTGSGLLVAVRLRDFSPQWFATYEREEPDRGRSVRRRIWMRQEMWLAQDEWVSSPPLVSKGRVILAADDSDKLLCFNAEDGTQVWSRPRDDHRYLIGCDRERVFVGGKHVAAYSIEDGKSVWEFVGASNDQPLGRPAITQDGLLVATDSQLVRLNLEDGAPSDLGIIEPGNLLVIPGAVYSASPYAISKLTDPVQAEQLVRSRLETAPDDVEANMKLAQILQRQEKLDAAHDQIEKTAALMADMQAALPEDDLVGRSLLTSDLAAIAHTRVMILHALAAEQDDDSERLDLLEQALAVAQSPSDTILAALALADHQYVLGEVMSAATRCVDLFFGETSGPIDIGPTWRINGTIEIGRRMAGYYRALAEREQSELLGIISQRLEDLKQSNRDGRLGLIVDGLAEFPTADDYFVEHADSLSETGRVDTMNYYLHRAHALTRDETRRENISRRLLDSYLNPSSELVPNLDDAIDILRESSASLMETASSLSKDDGLFRTSSRGIVSLKSDLDSYAPDLFDGRSNVEFELVAEQVVPQTVTGARVSPLAPITSFWDRQRTFNPLSRVVPVIMCEQTRGISAQARDLERNLWENDLQLIALDDSESEQHGYRGLCDMVVSNGVAILHSGHRVDAVGLTTGKALWVPIPCRFHNKRYSEPSLVVHDGIVMIAIDAETIIAVPARSNAKPLWRRTWPRKQIARMCVGPSGKLILIDALGGGVQVIDPFTGRLEREYAFVRKNKRDKPDGDAAGERKFAVGDGMLASAAGREVIVRRLETGEVAWRFEADNDILQIFGTDKGRFVVFSGATRVDVLRSDRGTVETSFDALGLTLPPQDLVIDRPRGTSVERLMLFAVTDDGPDSMEYVLDSYPLTPEPIPFRREFGRFKDVEVMINPRMLRMSRDYVPVITNTRQPEEIDRNNRFATPVSLAVAPQLTIVSKANESRLANTYVFEEGRLGGGEEVGANRQPMHQSRKIVDVMIMDQRIIAIAPEGYFVLARKEQIENSEGKP